MQRLRRKGKNGNGKVEAYQVFNIITFLFLSCIGAWQKTREVYGKEPWDCEEEELTEILVRGAGTEQALMCYLLRVLLSVCA